MTRPEIIVYRDKDDDILISLNGGSRVFYITLDGVVDPDLNISTFTHEPGDVEVWRSGPES